MTLLDVTVGNLGNPLLLVWSKTLQGSGLVTPEHRRFFTNPRNNSHWECCKELMQWWRYAKFTWAKNQFDTTVNSGVSETAMNTYETVARSYDGNRESLPKVKNQHGTATNA